MFAISFSGLEIKGGGSTGPVEVEESETTARSAVYQVLSRLFTAPDTDHFEKALDGRWAKELSEATTLLPFALTIGEELLPGGAGLADYEGEYARLFQSNGDDVKAIWAGAYFDDRAKAVDEVNRFYEYYGLGADNEGIPGDHLSTECDFMQYLTFQEAAAPAERRRASYQRAQLDFMNRHMGLWLPSFVEHVGALDPIPFFAWAVQLLAAFAEADHVYVRQVGAS